MTSLTSLSSCEHPEALATLAATPIISRRLSICLLMLASPSSSFRVCVASFEFADASLNWLRVVSFSVS